MTLQADVDNAFRQIVGKPRFRINPADADALGEVFAGLLKEHGVLGGLIEFRISDDDDNDLDSGSFEWDHSQTVREDVIEARALLAGGAGADPCDYSATTEEVLPRVIEYMREEGDYERANWYSQYLPTGQEGRA